MNPRPYSRIYTLTGTDGFANKISYQRYYADQVDAKNTQPREPEVCRAACSRKRKKKLMRNPNQLARWNWKKMAKNCWRSQWYGLRHRLPVSFTVCATVCLWIWMYTIWLNGVRGRPYPPFYQNSPVAVPDFYPRQLE